MITDKKGEYSLFFYKLISLLFVRFFFRSISRCCFVISSDSILFLSRKTSCFAFSNFSYIAGEVLTTQEIRNAIYHSTWLTDAKSVFSRRNCAANKNYGKYMSGNYIRQEFIETALIWASDAEGIKGKDAIETYMQKHSGDLNADALWKYFEDVFKWVQSTFGRYDKTMKGIKWGILYNKHKDDNLDIKEIQERVSILLADEEVQKKAGIYECVITGEEKLLNLRVFSPDEKLTLYNKQDKKCKICGKPFDIKDMHGDHIKAWSKGGKTVISNGQMLCTTCNIRKSSLNV